MKTVSLHYKLPNVAPFDKENWFESFLGEVVLPIVKTKLLDSFWFSQYGNIQVPEVRFRLKIDDFGKISDLVLELEKKYGLIDVGDEKNYEGKEIRNHPRFLGENHKQSDKDFRYELIWNFLFASARLYLDCLSHRDEDGRWSIEQNSDPVNCAGGNTVSSFHHLFCNLTNYRPLLFETGIPHPKYLSPMYYYSAKIHEFQSKEGRSPKSLAELGMPPGHIFVKF
jgi:hypothetical protein